MNMDVQFSEIQGYNIVEFSSLDVYYKCIDFLDNKCFEWVPLRYSARKDSASIRVSDFVLKKIWSVMNVEIDFD